MTTELEQEQEQEIIVTDKDIYTFREHERFEFDEEEVTLNTDLSTILIIDNLPTPDAKKMSKLTQLVQKIIEKKSPGAKVLSLELAKDENGAGKGFAFAELESAAQAAKAAKDVGGFAIEKGKQLVCTTMTEMSKYENIDVTVEKEEETERAADGDQKHAYKELDDLQWWLRDKLARDQFALRHRDVVEVLWNDKADRTELVYSRERWTEDRINWSPHGSYLVTWHKKGIALWGGPEWKPQASFPHSNPRFLDFSPRERYIITANGDAKDNVIIWDVRMGKKLRALTVPRDVLLEQWPFFKWSHDEKYFATLSPKHTGLTLFSTSNFKSQQVNIPRIQGFDWSPASNTIVYWALGEGNIPTKVSVAELPKLNELRFKNYYDVKNISFLWHESGKYVGVQVDRELKKKKKKAKEAPTELLYLPEEDMTPEEETPDITNIDIFRMAAGNEIPVETIELREPLTFFSWEPRGHHFAIVHGEQSSKRNVTIYSLEQEKMKEVGVLTEKSIDRCIWSPRGKFFVLNNSKTTTGALEFWDRTNLKEPISIAEHFMMTDMEWDPTGRYLATSVSYYERKQENGYVVWNALGDVVHKKTVDRLWQFMWRPRAPTLLNEKQEKAIKKILPKKSKQYRDEEKAAKEKARQEKLEKRWHLWNEFEEFEKRLQSEYEQDEKEREQLFGRATVADWETAKQTEEVLEETEEVIE